METLNRERAIKPALSNGEREVLSPVAKAGRRGGNTSLPTKLDVSFADDSETGRPIPVLKSGETFSDPVYKRKE
jgi:hypothetical protein